MTAVLIFFVIGLLLGMFTTCILVASDDVELEDALSYKVGFEEGYRQGKRDREE